MLQQVVSRLGGSPVNVVLRLLAAICAFVVEGIHLSILPDQAELWWGYGAFFLLACMAYGVLGVHLLLNPPGRAALLAGMVVVVGVLLTWLFTRIGGIPGVFTFTPLPIIDLDGAATGFSVLLLILLVLLFLRVDRRASAPRTR